MIMFKTRNFLYSFILLAFLISSWSTSAQTLIFQENFETIPISLNSTTTGTGAWVLNTRLHAEGLQSDSSTVNPGDTIYLSSNSFSTVGKSVIYLDFKHIAKVEYFDACEIEVSNDGGTSWSKLTTTEYKGTGVFIGNKFTAATYPSLWMAANNAAVPQNAWWKQERFDISTLVANAASVKIRFATIDKNNNGSQMSAGWFIDDIKIIEITCPAPTSQLTSNITDTSVVMAWTEKGSATQWDIEYGSSGFNLGSGTRITVTSNPDTLKGLTAYTNYDWYVRARCSANDSSYWLGPNSFVTAVGAHVLPLHESFENGLAYFDNKTGNDVNFIDETTLYHSGSHSVRNHYGSSNTNILEETSVIDLSATTSAVLIFWHIAKTEGGYDKCFVEISTDGGATYTALPNSTYQGSSLNYAIKGYFHEDSYTDWGTGSQSPANTWWKREKFDLSNYANANVKFRFRLTSDGSGQRAGWYIDDIQILEPTCPEPSNLASVVVTNSSASVDLVESGTANQWQIEYDTLGITFGNGNRNIITTHPDTLTGLYSNKAYNWYARAICGANDSSTWVGPNTFNTSCAPIITLPWSEGFENLPTTGTGVIPICMDEIGDWVSHSGSTTYNRGPHNGTNFIYTKFTANDWLISPEFHLVAGTHYDFSFYYITDGKNGWTTLETKIGNDQIKDSLKTAIGTPLSNINNTTYQKYEVTFTPSTSGSYYIGIHVVANGTPLYISFDDFKLDVSPTCPHPSNQILLGLTSNSAIVNWLENGNATQWDIEYDTTGFTFGTGNRLNAVSKPDTLGPLVSGKNYDWYVRSKCGPNDSSTWFGPNNFNFVGTHTLPVYDDFENGFSYFDNKSNNNTAFTDATGLFHSGTHSLKNNYGSNNSNVLEESGVIDLSSTPTAILDFWHIAKTEGGYDKCFVEISTDAGNTYTPLPNSAYLGASTNYSVKGYFHEDSYSAWGTGSQTPSNTWWKHETFSLSGYNVSNVRIRFRLTSDGSGQRAGWYLDDIRISVPNCSQPTNPNYLVLNSTTAIFSWTENGSATQWEIEYDTTNFVQGTGSIVTTNTNPDTISGLALNTSYDWYVRASCSASAKSDWTNASSFNTTCHVIANLPWTEGFENMTATGDGIIPQCAKGDGDWGTRSSAASYNRSANSGSKYLFTKYSADDWYISPKFQLTAGTSYDYTFYYNTDGKNGWTKMETKIGSTQLKDSMLTAIGTPVLGPNNMTYQQYRATFTVNTTGFYNIGLHIVAISSTWYITFDDFMLEESPSCPQPTNLTLNTVSEDTAIISWTETGSATQWEIEYGLGGYTQGSGTIIHTTQNPDTITSLLSGTTYDCYVRARCSTTDSSHWSGPISFTTNCSVITSLPWTEGFESMATVGKNKIPNCMLEVGDWGTSNTNLTYNRKPQTGSNYLYTKDNANDWFISPEFHLTAGTSYDYSFYYITDGKSGWTSLETKTGRFQHKDSMLVSFGTAVSGANNTTYQEYRATFTPTVSGSYYFGVHVTASYAPNYISFDNFTLEETPTCPHPSQPMSTILPNKAIVNWTETGSATQWEYEYGANGFSLGTGTRISTISKPDTINGLAAGDYDWYVRSRCSATDSSTWTIVSSFSVVGAHSFPLMEDFENGFTYFDNKSGNTVDFIDETSVIHSGGHSVKNDYSKYNENILLETGIMDLSNTNQPILEFWHIAKTEGGYDKCYVEVSTDGGNTFTAMPNAIYHGKSEDYSSKGYFHEDSYSKWGTSNLQTPNNTWWKRELFDVSIYKMTNVMFRFRIKSDVSGKRNGWYIDDIYIHEQQQYDLQAIRITKPKGLFAAVNSTIDTVSLLITNNGYDTIFPTSPASIKYEYDHQNPKSLVITDTIFPYEDTIVKINLPFTVLLGGKELKVYTSYSSDTDHANDTIVKTFKGVGLEVLSFADSFDVVNTFFAGGNSCWQKGDPEGTYIDTAHSSPNAWMTNLNNGYPNSTESYLYTPFFDFSSVLSTDSAVLSFYHWIDVFKKDGGYIQYTKNNGKTWLALGYKGISANKATNWYNDTYNGKHFWNALNTGWQKSEIKLPFHGATPIQFRFVFFSDSKLNTKDGWAIDNFEITLPSKPIDVGITAITTPLGSVQLGSNVSVTATIKNYGSATQTSFPVKYMVNGSTPVTQTYTASGTGLAPNATESFTFNTTFAAPAQDFKLCVYTNLTNDAYAQNDTTCTTVSVTPAALDAGVISIVANPHWNDTTKSSFDNLVSIQIVNFGLNTLTSIPLEYKVGSTVKANETWTGSLAATDTVSYTFTTTYKSGVGYYNLCAKSKLQNDANATNNSKCHNYLGILDLNTEYADGLKFSVNQNEPNPATDKARIDLVIPKDGKLIFTLHNNLGQLITENIYYFSVGINSIVFDVHDLPSGVYYYSVTYRDNIITKQMIVK